MNSLQQSALLIVGHGSTVNASSSGPSWMHAREIHKRGIFRQVQCAFWKEEPSLRDAQFFFDDGIDEVFVVPNFISEGYFTQTVIPRELELSGPITVRSGGQTWKYCEPVGNNSLVTEVLMARARAIAPEADPAESALLIVAHGTDLNENSAIAAKREVERLRSRVEYASISNVYMEEPPLISDWDRLTSARNVIVVPFFISDGLHTYEDIPVLLGVDTATFAGGMKKQSVFDHGPYQLRGRSLYYARSIGTDPRFADAIVEQALNMRSVPHAG